MFYCNANEPLCVCVCVSACHFHIIDKHANKAHVLLIEPNLQSLRELFHDLWWIFIARISHETLKRSTAPLTQNSDTLLADRHFHTGRPVTIKGSGEVWLYRDDFTRRYLNKRSSSSVVYSFSSTWFFLLLR